MRVFGRLSSVALALTGIAVGLADSLGLLQEKWAEEHLASVTLLVLGSLALFLGLSYDARFDALRALVESSKHELIDALGGVTLVHFKSPSEYWQYCIKRTSSATSVADLTWGRSTARQQTAEDARHYEAYRAAIPKACRRGARYREVFSFSSAIRLKRLDDVLKSRGVSSYSARYFRLDHDLSPPLIQFTLFDKQEVVIGPHRGDVLDPSNEVYLSITNPLLVQLFSDYFEAIWHKAIPIKDGIEIREAELIHVRSLWPSAPIAPT